MKYHFPVMYIQLMSLPTAHCEHYCLVIEKWKVMPFQQETEFSV